MTVSGLAVMPDGRVLVYDGRDARIKILSGGDLAPVKAFGRKGQGRGSSPYRRSTVSGRRRPLRILRRSAIP